MFKVIRTVGIRYGLIVVDRNPELHQKSHKNDRKFNFLSYSGPNLQICALWGGVTQILNGVSASIKK